MSLSAIRHIFIPYIHWFLLSKQQLICHILVFVTPSFRTSGKNLLIQWGASSIWIITNLHYTKSVSSDGDVFHLENSLTLFLLPAAVTIARREWETVLCFSEKNFVATTDMDCHLLQIQLITKTRNIV